LELEFKKDKIKGAKTLQEEYEKELICTRKRLKNMREKKQKYQKKRKDGSATEMMPRSIRVYSALLLSFCR